MGGDPQPAFTSNSAASGRKRGTHLLASRHRHLGKPHKKTLSMRPWSGRRSMSASCGPRNFPGFVTDGSRSYAKEICSCLIWAECGGGLAATRGRQLQRMRNLRTLASFYRVLTKNSPHKRPTRILAALHRGAAYYSCGYTSTRSCTSSTMSGLPSPVTSAITHSRGSRPPP